MNKLEYVESVRRALVKYYLANMSDSIVRNCHLTGVVDFKLLRNVEKGILVDIINNIAQQQGLDYAMSVGDFITDIKRIKYYDSNKTEPTAKLNPDNVVDLNI